MRWDYPQLDINPVFPGLGEIIIIIIVVIIIINYNNVIVIIIISIFIDYVCKTCVGRESILIVFEQHHFSLPIRSDLIGMLY